MKGVLLDQNLPVRLRFTPALPVVHATRFGPSPSDSELWRVARDNSRVIVTKDADFSARIILADPPPRVVHLRFGNLRLAAFHDRLASAWPDVERLLATHKLVNVFPERIEAIG
jgi:predicted nuclease of predicted toxin-antitoxin system